MSRPLQLSDDPEGDARKRYEAREQKLQFIKDRALEYLPDARLAFTSFISDANKDWLDDGVPLIDMTKPVMVMLSQLGMRYAADNNEREMRRWIEGFN